MEITVIVSISATIISKHKRGIPVKKGKMKIKLSETTNWLSDYGIDRRCFEDRMWEHIVDGTRFYSDDRRKKFEESFLLLVDYLIFSYENNKCEDLDLIKWTVFPDKNKYNDLMYDHPEYESISFSDIDWDDIMENVRNAPYHYPLSDGFLPINERSYAPDIQSSLGDMYGLLGEEARVQQEPIDEEDDSADVAEEPIEEESVKEVREFREQYNQTEAKTTSPQSDLVEDANPNMDSELRDNPTRSLTGIVKEEAIAAGVKWISCDIVPPEYNEIKDPTWKEDLYLSPYEVPCVDLDRIFFERKLDDYHFIMYESYPPIPTVQNEITCTTNENILTNRDRMALYPNRYIKTRPRELYNAVVGMEYHELLGSIVPVGGFTTEQIIDNIIRYPHFHCMRRIAGDGSYGNEFTPFWGEIEIDGQLHKLNEVWRDLPESKIIPATKEFMKEYQIRRYLLERDAGVKHKYPLQGDLGEFITLFMTPDMYIQLGYTDVEGMAEKCVHSRIKFHRTRNPMLRRFGVEND